MALSPSLELEGGKDGHGALSNTSGEVPTDGTGDVDQEIFAATLKRANEVIGRIAKDRDYTIITHPKQETDDRISLIYSSPVQATRTEGPTKIWGPEHTVELRVQCRNDSTNVGFFLKVCVFGIAGASADVAYRLDKKPSQEWTADRPDGISEDPQGTRSVQDGDIVHGKVGAPIEKLEDIMTIDFEEACENPGVFRDRGPVLT